MRSEPLPTGREEREAVVAFLQAASRLTSSAAAGQALMWAAETLSRGNHLQKDQDHG